MAVTSQRKARTRKHTEAQEPTDAAEIDSYATPGRKRRKVNAHPNTESPSTVVPATGHATTSDGRNPRPSESKVYEDESSFNEDDPEYIIRNLRQAKYQIAARIDYANEVHEANNPQGKQAYAKIAGHGWTFYVDELEVRIGRPPEERQSVGPPSAGGETPSIDRSLVHIDLGPNKLVSRQHAEIRFDDSSGRWVFAVSGRNGARVDEAPLGRGDMTTLRSGSIIEVAGTEMMFVTPNEEPQVDSAIVERYRRYGGEDEGDDDDIQPMQPPALPHRTPTKGSQSHLSNGHNISSSQHGLPNNHGGRQYGGKATAPSALAQNDGSGDSAGSSSQQRSKDSPTYPRGLLLETTEEIDYSADSAKDLKPPHSYAQLIGMAILSSPEEKLTLAKIYDWIKERYAYYKFSGGGWQNSIRHNLSLNKNFEKVARRTDEPGKGMKWQIKAESREEFLKKGLSSVKKITRSSSVPNSPAHTKGGLSSTDGELRSDSQFLRDFHDLRGKHKIEFKTSPDSTPPMSHFPQAKQAFTPDRGSNIFSKLHGLDTSSPRNGVIPGFSPFPFSALKDAKTNGLTEAAAAGSPGGPRISLNSEVNEHLFTPLITKNAPKLAPPSTARLPSQFMPMSSPAPFWKYADFGSTPAKPDTSPVKGFKHEAITGPALEKHESKDSGPNHKTLGIQSSSPPLPEVEVGSGSPSKGSGLRKSTTELPLSTQQAVRQRSPGKVPPPNFVGSQRTTQPNVTADNNDDDGEDGVGIFDLARGFQPIGSFHRNMSAGIVGRN